MRPLLLSLFAISAIALTAGPKVHTLDVGKNPESVTRGWGGDLFVTIMGERGDHPSAAIDGAIHRVDADGNVSPFYLGGLQEPKGIVFTGESLVTADKTHVWRIDISGRKTLLAGPQQFPQAPVYLNDVALDPKNRGVFVTDMNNAGQMSGPNGFREVDDPVTLNQTPGGRVYHISWDGTVTLVIGDSANMLHPNGTFVEPDGRVLAASFFLGHIVAAYPGEEPKIIATGHRSADGVETDDAGNLFLTEVFTGKIWQYPPHGREPILLHTAQSAADHYLDRDRNLLIVPDSRAGQLVFIHL
ncbi:MAG: hypothetical protein SynsKO_02590 [Synoicihabitans sp.]